MDSDAWWSQFSIAFWSGLIYSVIAGIIAGVAAVLILESKRAHREIKTLRERIRLFLNRPGRIERSSVLYAAPLGAVAIAELIDNAPLDSWDDSAECHSGMISAFRRFQLTFTEFANLAYQFDKRLIDLIDAAHRGANLGAHLWIPLHEDDNTVAVYVRSAQQMITGNGAWVALARPNVNYGAITNDPDLQNWIKALKEQRALVVDSFDDLRKRVNQIE